MADTAVPEIVFAGSVEEHVRKIALGLEQALAGKLNNVITITLVADADETRIERTRVTTNTRVAMIPQSASAATAVGSGTLWVETHFGEIIVHHDSQPGTDRIFGAILVG